MKFLKSILTIFIWVSLFVQVANAQVSTLSEDFTSCPTFPIGWQQYSVIGNQVWGCTNSGYIGRGIEMNGFSGGNQNNEDWLISPQISLSTFSKPLLSLWSRTRYSGPFIQILVSTNYSGSGNPNSATWTPLSVILPTSNSDVWFYSSGVNLSAYKSTPFYLAVKYTSNTSAAAQWKLDNITITEGALQLPKRFVNAGECAAGYFSAGNTFQFKMDDLTGILLVNAPSPFQISKDGTNFSNQLSYNASTSGITQTVHVRIAPTVANKVYRSGITFVNNTNNIPDTQFVLGTSLSDDKTLRVVSWNMRWFGEPTWCDCDTALAKVHALKVLRDLDADVYCLQEIVNVNQLAFLTASLGPNYQYAVSGFCSGVTNPSSGFYNSCQKLAYIYNTSKVQNLGSFGLLASTYPSDSSAYHCFSSGRFPFIMRAKILLAGGASDTVIFSNIHAKASNTADDYNRRVCAAQKMTDSLNALFPNKKVLIIGDFNDYLEGSSYSGSTTSPYNYLLNNGYSGITLPSIFAGQSTFVGSTDHMIDNVVCSQALMPRYIDSSCFIFTEANKYINSLSDSLSDHYAVMSYFQFNFPNSMSEIEAPQATIASIVNPSQGILTLLFKNQNSSKTKITITDLYGKKINEYSVSSEPNMTFQPSIQAAGMYLVRIEQADRTQTLKWLIIK